jgi:hypothetical protein
MSAISMTQPRGLSLGALNGRYHRTALTVFMVIVLAHWAEHVVQAYQVWVLDRPRPQSAGGVAPVLQLDRLHPDGHRGLPALPAQRA